MKELTIDLRTAFVSPPMLFRKALRKGIHEIDRTDIIDRDAVQLADTVVVVDGLERRILKSRESEARHAWS